MSDLWMMDYERVADDYTRDCEKHNPELAEARARNSLKRLGFDPNEIDNEIDEMKK